MGFGIWKAFKQDSFETRKAFKAVIMLVAFEALLAVLLTIEKGFPFASWISEAVILPIIMFELISILKNMHLIGLIDNTLLAKILKNVDKHKEV
jgi:phage-related holin